MGNNPIASIRDKVQKFLGKVLFYKGKYQETFNYIKDICVEGIKNIEKAMVRNEFKLWIYSNYFLPSKLSCSPYMCSMTPISTAGHSHR